MERIGLFGGSFDPVHAGHLLVAQAALEEVPLDRLFFIPAAQSPFKQDRPRASGALRLRMLRQALAGQTRCEVDPREIERGGVSYSVDTVRDYAKRRPNAELFYLVGADHLPTLPQWREAEELAAAVTFLVVSRPGKTAVEAPSGFQTRALRGVPFGVSASRIRERVRERLPIELLTSPAVAETIGRNGLYREGRD